MNAHRGRNLAPPHERCTGSSSTKRSIYSLEFAVQNGESHDRAVADDVNRATRLVERHALCDRERGADRAAVRDHQHVASVVALGDPSEARDDPGSEFVVRLAVVPAVAELEPACETRRIALLDIRARKP